MDVGRQIFALVRSLFFGTLFVSLWTWFVPRWISRGPLQPDWNIVSIVLMTIGGAIMIKCVFDFSWRGLGTPFPLDPPRRLVVSGLYRWVRNPMYVGMGILLTGEALLLPAIMRQMFMLTAILWAAVTIFIVVFEEPALRQKFGGEYEGYCRQVRRWIPRLRPFDNPQPLP